MTDTFQQDEPLRPKSDLPAPTEWLNTDETADQLGLKPKTLINMRSLGTGPVYHKIGAKVWYRGKDIIAYTNGRRFMGSGLRDGS